MSKEYKVDKEYSLAEIIRYNLRMWWLAVILAVICAGILGGYKYVSLRPFVENEAYENKQQVVCAMFVTDYSDTSVIERANNVIKIAMSSRAYENFCEDTEFVMSMEEYRKLFEMQQSEASGVVSMYVTFPVSVGSVTIADEETAKRFAQEVMETTIKTTQDMIGDGVSILDVPYVTQEVVKLESYSISRDDFQKGVLKGITAGVLLGIIVEVVLYTFWMLIYKKPKNADEVRQCVDSNIIDVLKDGEDDENGFKKVALYLADDTAVCNKISCITLQCPKKDAALKLAMSYANEQKKTLYVDLSVKDGDGTETNSISGYVLGEKEEVQVLQMNAYLDSVCRSTAAEKGMDLVGNKRFGDFLHEMEGKYECIVINSADVSKSPEAYAVSKFCNKKFLVCGRKTVKNEALYRVKNIADVNDIQIDGVLVYEL